VERECRVCSEADPIIEETTTMAAEHPARAAANCSMDTVH
jgi:hypothetical protein